MDKYYPINKFAKIIGVTSQTLRNWEQSGKLVPHHRSDSNYRYYSESQLQQILGEQRGKRKLTIGYCRVSSQKQKDDLDRQVENMRLYLLAQGTPYEIITDIGSGINYKKPGLQDIIKRICNYEVLYLPIHLPHKQHMESFQISNNLSNTVFTFICIVRKCKWTVAHRT